MVARVLLEAVRHIPDDIVEFLASNLNYNGVG
jgi:hypothetical protein